MATIREAVEQIKKAGLDKVRKIPEPNGRTKIQVNLSGAWVTVFEAISPKSADDIIRQASDRVIME